MINLEIHINSQYLINSLNDNPSKRENEGWMAHQTQRWDEWPSCGTEEGLSSPVPKGASEKAEKRGHISIPGMGESVKLHGSQSWIYIDIVALKSDGHTSRV
ncbi:hypothetical protein BU17DRAFT_66017 [Hysterangium stoloniferum]|nr:hypothetical protein BU17DRAFT_66017 [Hysterangium stoloniferum]